MQRGICHEMVSLPLTNIWGTFESIAAAPCFITTQPKWIAVLYCAFFYHYIGILYSQVETRRTNWSGISSSISNYRYIRSLILLKDLTYNIIDDIKYYPTKANLHVPHSLLFGSNKIGATDTCKKLGAKYRLGSQCWYRFRIGDYLIVSLPCHLPLRSSLSWFHSTSVFIFSLFKTSPRIEQS